MASPLESMSHTCALGNAAIYVSRFQILQGWTPLRSLEQLLPLLQFFALQVFELLGCEGLVAVNMKVRLIMVDMPGIF